MCACVRVRVRVRVRVCACIYYNPRISFRIYVCVFYDTPAAAASVSNGFDVQQTFVFIIPPVCARSLRGIVSRVTPTTAGRVWAASARKIACIIIIYGGVHGQRPKTGMDHCRSAGAHRPGRGRGVPAPR